MDINDSCVQRRIKNTNVKTPLLVPSFSSAFRQDPTVIGKIHNSLSEYLFEVSLVSAYDLYYNYINIENISISDLVFLDSGNYEIESLKNSKLLETWNQELYLSVIDRLTDMNQFVIVNYDQKISTETQIKSANRLFDKIKNIKFAKCFLYKPLKDESFIISVRDIQNYIDSFTDFDIIGLTDKELGDSLLTRCRNIVDIRSILYESGAQTPLHIFGCLDPLTIILYFLCGADIFDGLAWLKYTFFNHLALYYNNHSLINAQWNNSYDNIHMHNAIENLNTLNTLSSHLNHYRRTKNFESLQLDENVLQQVKSLTGAAGIDY